MTLGILEIISSTGRVDHFTNSDQPYALAFDMVASFINMIMSEAK